MLSKSRTFRCFIAVYPNREAIEAVTPFVEDLRARSTQVRWERIPNLHITLKFLGDTTAEQVRSLDMLLRRSVEGMSAITTQLDTPGAFPHFRRPKVVWLGFSQRCRELDILQRAVEDACVTLGFERELKSFTPHFTIGRVPADRRIFDLEKDIRACRFQAVLVTFSDLRIMESTLKPGGAVHREVTRIELVRTPGGVPSFQ